MPRAPTSESRQAARLRLPAMQGRQFFRSVLGRWQIGAVITASVLLPCMAKAADPSPVWRFWDYSDGLIESHILHITEDPSGAIWIKHGLINFMDVFDGYSMTRVPDPLGFQHIHASWTVTPQGLSHYENGKWVLYPCSFPLE